MKTALEVITKISDDSKLHQKDDVIVPAIEVGQFIRQGDVYLTRLDAKPAKFNAIRKSPQVAEGVTQGSRHVVRMEAGIELYDPPRGANALQGPVVVAPKRFWLDHPEHHNFSLPAGTYQVTYQRDYSSERIDELRRVAD